MRKKKKIAELMNKLEEISKINEALLLENAEQKARLKTAEDELAKAEVEKVADEAEAALTEEIQPEAEAIEETVEEDAFGETDDGEDIEDEEITEESQEASDLEKIVQIIKSADIREQILEALDAKPEVKDEIEPIAQEKPVSAEIERLKSRSDKLEAELSEIKKLILQKNTVREETVITEDTSVSEVNPAITKNIGKLIVDAQMGAKRIIDQAKNEAEEYLQKARQDADLIVSQAEFRSRNIYKGFCDAEAEIDQLIMKMEDISEQIQIAKRALKN